MASVRVEGILGHVLVAVEWVDGEVTGSPVLLKSIEQEAREQGTRFYEDPLAFAALATSAIERYSDEPARVTSEGVTAPIEQGIADVAG